MKTQFLPTPHRWLIICFSTTAILLTIFGLPYLGSSMFTDVFQKERVTKDRLDRAIRDAAGYIVRSCHENGQFQYRINLNPDVKVSRRYNLVRHAGTLYALSMYYHYQPDPDVRNALIRAARFFRVMTLGPVLERPDVLGVWSRPELTGEKGPIQVKLGGNGLGLVGLIGAEQVAPGTVPIAELQKMAECIRFMQKPDGSFYSKYIPTQGGRMDNWVSLYYPGEAALGLLMLYEMDPRHQWLDSAAKALAYLAQIRKGKTSVKADHWALLATAKLLSLDNDPQVRHPLSKQIAVNHAVQICKSILSKRIEHPRSAPEFGCFTSDGRTCPTATRLEGLLAAYRFLPKSHSSLKSRIRDAVDDGIRFLIRAQINQGPHMGAIPRAIHPLPSDHPARTKSFNQRATEVRIDYVQHTLSALIQYARLTKTDSN